MQIPKKWYNYGMRNLIQTFDERFISFLRKFHEPLARLAIFIVYFWFGALKVFGDSPANPLVENLLGRTMPFVSFEQFIVGLGIFEMIIGVAFLVRGFERAAIALLFPHMVTTFMPLVLLPQITWTGFLVPTLEGQYIIKNLLIIALAFGLASNLTPFRSRT
jgi:uncharacterized membrane protein YkgB